MSKFSGRDGEVKTRLKSVSAMVLVPVTAALIFTGCGNGDDSGSKPSTGDTGDAIVTGSAQCNDTEMAKAVQSWSEANGGDKATLPDSPGTYRCADGWAVAFPNVGSGEAEVTVTAVFEAEGQFWIPKDRAQVCGETASDSEVPKSLYKAACQTN